ncbi:unnamed protein product [Phytophthora lilii]|uniref:Unnamed protein product n=1 Tax=Phytophthora lilii TaxID=2077276 RepID=A0A9W6U2B6_9STRA|nr:unnamed protein product [Phytophthora lilii]
MGDRERVRTLLSTSNVCVLERDACGRIALQHAVVTENLKIAKRLLRRQDAKLQVHVRDNSGRTALHYALEKMEMLACHRCEGSGIPALVTVEMREECKRYRRLWKLADNMLELFCISNLEEECNWDGIKCESLKLLDMRCRGDVWDACRSGDLERLQTLVKIYDCTKEVWELSELKKTLLHEASEYRQLQVVYFLISTVGVPVLTQDTSGCTALHCAARRGYVDVCQLQFGKLTAIDKENIQLHEATEELALLQDVNGRTALHWCLLGVCDSLSRIQVGEFLAQACSAALHICDHNSVFPLHLAIWRGDLELVQLFISLGASIYTTSVSSNQPERLDEKEKASWAPCGIIFQRHDLRKIQKAAPQVKPINPSVGTVGNNARRINTPDWENFRHPVESLWYWNRRTSPRGQKKMAKNMKTEGSKQALRDEELGCRKYGGICDDCKVIDSHEVTKKSSRTSENYPWHLLPYLLLALRVGALKWNKSDSRRAIIKLLLMNGVNPDGATSGEDQQLYSQNQSALSEGLRSCQRGPEILLMLLQYGAEQINAQAIVQWCSSTSLTEANQVETALSQILSVKGIRDNCEVVTMLFERKYFDVLKKAMALFSDNLALPWKMVHETLMTWSKQKKKPGDTKSIDTDHVKFILDSVEIKQPNGDPHVVDKWSLLKYCADLYFQQQALGSYSEREISRDKCEGVLLKCIQGLFRHWKGTNGNSERIEATATAWLKPTILLGYFDCSLVLLETLNRLGHGNGLLDKVFQIYAEALGVRRRQDNPQLRYHREFIIVCAENLLKGDARCITEEPRNTVTAQSVAHICANNMPITVLKRCFEIVFSGSAGSLNKATALTKLKTVRIRGRTMMQWIVLHSRFDIVQWLLASFSEASDRCSYWSEFVCASIAIGSNGYGGSSSIIDKLFSLFSEHVKIHLSGGELVILLVSLVTKCAIPNDHIALIAQLVNNLKPSDPESLDGSTMISITIALKEASFVRDVARWNAIHIAEMCLSGQGLAEESELTRIDWQQLFVEEIRKRHELDECTPLELCRLLGHNRLYSLFSTKLLRFSNTPFNMNASAHLKDPDEPELEHSDTDDNFVEPQSLGSLRSVIDIHENLVSQSTGNVGGMDEFMGYQRCISVDDRWVSAVAHNQVPHLQAMALTPPQCTVSVRALVLTAIKTASMDALKWILESNAPIVNHLSDSESEECLHAAARHPGDACAEMTLLLLENRLSPGRLSGDGMGVPLLHRVACFSNTTLACRAMKMLLERTDCDVNALDAFGNTAVSYALASGCLHNACFLIQCTKCRLEAEYEGQSSFYYALHIAPSFSFRVILRELLIAKRDRAFLHCVADNKTCGCKSYERPPEAESTDVASPELCAFCGHESTSHRTMPLPSWFRDQYDTYAGTAANSPRKRFRSSSDEGDDSNGETHLTDSDGDADEDEETVLENGRGRLDVGLLRRITALRYDDILQTNGLTLAAAVDMEEETITALSDPVVGDNCEPTLQVSTEKEVAALDCTVKQQELDAADDILHRGADQCVKSSGATIGAVREGAASGRKLSHCPWWLRQELAMVHSPRCLCQQSGLVINRAQLAHIAVCRWLRRTAIVHLQQQHRDLGSLCSSSTGETESAIVALASMQPAFERWRDVAQQLSARAGAVSRPETPLPSVLRSVLFQWQHGKEFLAFQRWKNFQTSAEVVHHRLATRLHQVAADMRRNRFASLQLRQQQLHDSTRSLRVSSP